MQSFLTQHSLLKIKSIVMQDHRKSVGTPQLDPQVLGQLYETHAPQLLNLCLRYVKNRAEAEDVLHDAFVVIFTHIDNLRDETKLVHWMTVIVRNLALRHAKAAEERLRLHEAITEEPADDDSPTSSSVIPMERLLEAIETLPRGYGEVGFTGSTACAGKRHLRRPPCPALFLERRCLLRDARERFRSKAQGAEQKLSIPQPTASQHHRSVP